MNYIEMKQYYLAAIFCIIGMFFWAQAPVVSITATSTQVCQGNSLALTANTNQPSSTFLWSTGATSSSIIVSPAANTTYTCIVTANGQSSTAGQAITVLSNPTANAGADITKTCASNANGAFIGMTAQPGVTYSWSPSAGLNAPTLANPIANPTATTSYTLTATHTQSGCVATDVVLVTVNQQTPTADAGLDGEKTCIQNSTGVQIGALAQTGQTYSWTPVTGLSASGVANPIANPTTTTNYTLTVTNTATGCTSTDQVLVSVNTSLPTANAGLDFIKTCVLNTNGLTIGQTAVSGVSYSWSPSLGLSNALVSNPIANPSTTTSYTLTATQANNGCVATDQILVTVNQQFPIPNAGVDLLKTCTQNASGATLGAAAQSGVTYSWNPSTGLSTATNSTPFANPMQTTTYTVTATQTSSGCSSTDQMTFVVNVAVPVANAGVDFSKTCVQNPNGLQIGSSPVAGYSYNWFPTLGLSSATTSNPIANPTQNTSYLLTVTDQISGCTATDQLAVTVNTTAPTANAGADFTKTCVSNVNGLLIGAGATAGLTYSWSPAIGLSASNTANPIANPSVTTAYTLTVNNPATGCTGTDVVLVTVNQTAPLAQAGPDFQKNCYQNLAGSVIGMTPVTGNTYQWSPITGLNNATAANPLANPSVTTTYTLTVTNYTNGCVTTDQVIVTVDIATPTVNAGNDFAINCFGNFTGATIGMNPAPGITYSWAPVVGLNNPSASNTWANPTQTTTYSLTALNPINGCQITDQVLVTVNLTTPLANAGPDKLKNCSINTTGAMIGGLPQAQTNYSWSPTIALTTPNAAQTWANPSQSMWYVVTATNWESGCSDIDSVYFEVNIVAPIIEAGFNQSVCLGDSILVSATYPAGTQMSWNNGIQNNQYFIPTVSQYYTLTVVGTNGCQSQDSLFVQVNPLPGIYAGPDIEICAGQNVTLAGSFGTIYYWSGGIQNGVPFIPNATGVYTVTGIDINGCQNNDLVMVTVHANPVVSAGADPAICLGDSVLLSATGALSYVWSNGMANGSYITPNFNTLLEVTGTNQFGCTGSDLFDITVNQPTNATINVVFQGPYTLNGITYNVSGTYTQVIPNAAGCDSTITLNYELVDVGVNELSLTQIEVYPNPFGEQIWMTYNEALIGEQLLLQDLSGRVIKRFELSADLKMELELGALPSGTYLFSTAKTLPVKVIKL